MELKKNPNVDINKDRLVYRAIGYAFVLAFTFIMFSFTVFEKKKMKVKTAVISDDAEQVENTRHEVAPPPPPPSTGMLLLNKTEFEAGEEIVVSFTASAEFEENAWVGCA